MSTVPERERGGKVTTFCTWSAVNCHYLEEVSFSEFKCLGFKLNPLPRLGLDGVDTFVIVIVVHRKVGGQQSALSARDRIPTLRWNDNHNIHRLTHSHETPLALHNLTGATRLPGFPSACGLSVSRTAYQTFNSTSLPTIPPAFFICLALLVPSLEIEDTPLDVLFYCVSLQSTGSPHLFAWYHSNRRMLEKETAIPFNTHR